MSLLRNLAALILLIAIVPMPARTAAGAGGPALILPASSRKWITGEWQAYRSRFVSPDGRVIDNANGGISHSEGQGYGLLLALAAGDAAGFDTIWRWTAGHLRTRPDALFAWKWDPQRQATTDRNDASDGDLLIASALVRGAERFARRDYATEAHRIVAEWAAKVVVTHGTEVLLLPGAAGFGADDQPSGPVVNLSYWIFAAMPDLARFAPKLDWTGLRRSGFDLLAASRFGPARLPAEWIALGGGTPAPAPRYPAEFGYNAIRIPLYLAQDRTASLDLLAPYASPDFPGPGVIDLATGAVRQPMPDAGYRAVLALARCAVRGEPIPADLVKTRDNLYYPETLRLLALLTAQERFPRCL